MCIGLPMQVIAVAGLTAECESVCAGGVQHARVSLALVGPVAPGAYVLVHINSAVRVIDAGEATAIANALEAVHAAAAGEDFEHLLGDLANREPELPEHLRPAGTQSPTKPAATETAS